MDDKTADAYVYGALGLSTALYAVLLDYNKQHARSEWKIEPDWTWATVVLGCGMCLAAASIRVRLLGASDRAATERAVRRAFVVGGGPIILWQIWRRVARLRSRENTLRHYTSAAEETHAQNDRQRPPTTMAPLRWPGPQAN